MHYYVEETTSGWKDERDADPTGETGLDGLHGAPRCDASFDA